MSTAPPKLRDRISNESGFTLIELLIVLVIVGILLAIAVPSYLDFRGRASQTAAQANVRSAVPVVETYYADHDTYTGMTLAGLRAIDASVEVTVVSASGSDYCISNSQGGVTYYKQSSSGSITATACT